MTDPSDTLINRSLLIAGINLYEKYLTECLSAQKDGTWKAEMTLKIEMAIRGLLLDARTAAKGNDYSPEEIILLTSLEDAFRQLPREFLNPNNPAPLTFPEPFLNALDKAISLRQLVKEGQKNLG